MSAQLARIQTYAFSGIEAVPVEVQVQVGLGLPAILKAGSVVCCMVRRKWNGAGGCPPPRPVTSRHFRCRKRMGQAVHP